MEFPTGSSDGLSVPVFLRLLILRPPTAGADGRVRGCRGSPTPAASGWRGICNRVVAMPLDFHSDDRSLE